MFKATEVSGRASKGPFSAVARKGLSALSSEPCSVLGSFARLLIGLDAHHCAKTAHDSRIALPRGVSRRVPDLPRRERLKLLGVSWTAEPPRPSVTFGHAGGRLAVMVFRSRDALDLHSGDDNSGRLAVRRQS